ncbi:MAG: hypothetical protein GWN00_15595, partial [Aliifodinibius sp.]|nr:hypothetical protein [Fodinibius sp.]NIV12487.1 hypothetical protein [Fodinibius sp.]NIY26175.1 hypothetical protein [Fodinibius sp.]
PGNISLKGVKNCTVKNCRVYYSWGANIIVDGNGEKSTGVIIEDNFFGDSWNGINLHAVQDVVVQRNIIYSTKTGRSYMNQGSYGAAGGVFTGGENG